MFRGTFSIPSDVFYAHAQCSWRHIRRQTLRRIEELHCSRSCCLSYRTLVRLVHLAHKTKTQINNIVSGGSRISKTGVANLKGGTNL